MNLPEFTDDERKYYREVWGFDPTTDHSDLPGGGKGYQATFALDFSGVSMRVEVYRPDYQPGARIILEHGEKRTDNFLEEINDEEYLQLLGEPNLEFYSKYFPKFQELDKFLEKFPYDRVPEKKAAFLFAACSYIAKIIAGCGLRKFLFSTVGSHFENVTRLHSGLCVVLDELHIPELTQMQHEFILKLIEQASEEWLITNWEPVSIDFRLPHFLFSSNKGGLYPLLPTPLQEKILRVATKVAPKAYIPNMSQPGVKITPFTDEVFITGYIYEKCYQIEGDAKIIAQYEINYGGHFEAHIWFYDGNLQGPIDLIKGHDILFWDIWNEIDIETEGITDIAEFALMCAFVEILMQINATDLHAAAKSCREEIQKIENKNEIPGNLFFSILKRINPQEFSAFEKRVREVPLNLEVNQDPVVSQDSYLLYKGGFYAKAKNIPEAAESYQNGILYLMQHPEEDAHNWNDLWSYLGTTFFDRDLYGETYYCWSKASFVRDKFIKGYLTQLRDKCALARVPPFLNSTNEKREGPVQDIDLPTTGSMTNREQRMLALFSPLTPVKDKVRLLGEILAIEIPDESESIDTITVLECAISARMECHIDNEEHAYYRGPHISLQVVTEDPICPRPERFEEIPPISEEKWHLRVIYEEDWPLTPQEEEALDDRESYGYEHNGPPRITYELDIPRFLDLHRDTKWNFRVD